jgi:citrate lyase subunit beta/citryl-CoA lyase
MSISDYLGASHQRIVGLTWGAQDLAAAISGTASYETGRGWSDIFKFVRAQTLLTAHAAGMMTVDTSFVDLEDLEGLGVAARASRADGFTGMLAIHPDQVGIINRAFTPSPEEIQEARDIVAAFDASPDLGSLEYKGRMIDKPRLRLARRMLGISAEDGPHAAGQRQPILRPA